MTTDESTPRYSRAFLNKKSTLEDHDKLPALSTAQPYAGLIRLAGEGRIGKDIEIKGMRYKYRGPLVICASARIDQDAYRRVQRLLVGNGVMRLPEYEATCGAALCGKAVALFDLRNVRRMVAADHERAFTSDAVVDLVDQYAWVAGRITALKPFDVAGMTGIFRVDKQVVMNACGTFTTPQQRDAIWKRTMRRAMAPTCTCGRKLPVNLAEFMNNLDEAKHECECGQTWSVKGMKFIQATAMRKDKVA